MYLKRKSLFVFNLFHHFYQAIKVFEASINKGNDFGDFSRGHYDFLWTMEEISRRVHSLWPLEDPTQPESENRTQPNFVEQDAKSERKKTKIDGFEMIKRMSEQRKKNRVNGTKTDGKSFHSSAFL